MTKNIEIDHPTRLLSSVPKFKIFLFGKFNFSCKEWDQKHSKVQQALEL